MTNKTWVLQKDKQTGVWWCVVLLDGKEVFRIDVSEAESKTILGVL